VTSLTSNSKKALLILWLSKISTFKKKAKSHIKNFMNWNMHHLLLLKLKEVLKERKRLPLKLNMLRERNLPLSKPVKYQREWTSY